MKSGSVGSKFTGSSVAGSRPIRFAIEAYAASCACTPSAGCTFNEVARPALVQVGEEAGRVREQVGVPGVAGPAAAVLRVDVDPVPVHVDDRDRERHVLGGEPVHQRDVLVGGVGVVAAPPVAERVAGQQRGRPGQLVERLEGPLVVAAEREEVEVERAGAARGDPAPVVEQHALGVVDQRDAVERQDAVLQRDRAVDVVEGAGGAAEVGGVLPVAPHRVVGVVAALGLHRQAVRGERPLVVDQVQPVGVDLQQVLGLGHREVARREGPVHRGLGRPVLEGAGLVVLQPDQAGVQDGDPVAVAADHVGRVGDRVGVEPEVLLHGCAAWASQTLPMTDVRVMRIATRSGFSRGWR